MGSGEAVGTEVERAECALTLLSIVKVDFVNLEAVQDEALALGRGWLKDVSQLDVLDGGASRDDVGRRLDVDGIL